MSVAALRERIAREATANLMPVLIERAALQHRKGWRDCGCTWCELKRMATWRLGTGMSRIPDRERREEVRNEIRLDFRAKLASAYDEGIS